MALTQISTAGVKDDAVTSGKIPANAVGSSELADDAVDTNAIVDDAVTADKIADQAVTLNKLPHGTGHNDGKFLRANNGADPSFETVSIPAGTTINNNANNRIITGSDTANTLEGESKLTFDGTILKVQDAAISGYGSQSSTLLVLEDSGDTSLEIASGHNNTSSIFFGDTGASNKGQINYLHGTGGDAMSFHANGSECMRVTSAGDVIIHGTNLNNSAVSGQALQVNGTTRPTLILRGNADGNQVGEIQFADNSGSDDDNTGIRAGLIQYDHGSNFMAFRTQAVERMRITSAGKVGIGMTNPDDTLDVNGTFQVSSNSYMSNLYMSGSLFIGGTGSANELDDYEEGAWTPVVTFGGNSAGQSYNNQVGRYVKIGRLVQIQCYIYFSDKGTSTGTAKITGLPFPFRNQSSCWQASKIGYWNAGNSGAGPGSTSDFMAYGEINQTVMNIQRQEMNNNTPAINDATDANLADNTDFMLSMSYITN